MPAPVAAILAMQTTSLDLLEKAQLPPVQSHAMLKAMEMEMAADHGLLAAKGDFLAAKADLLAAKHELKSEIIGLRIELLTKIGDLRAEMRASEGTLSRWVLACIMGQTVALAGVGYFLLTHFKR
jgi:hypothetical protein